jgi:hypothetical protein
MTRCGKFNDIQYMIRAEASELGKEATASEHIDESTGGRTMPRTQEHSTSLMHVTFRRWGRGTHDTYY